MARVAKGLRSATTRCAVVLALVTCLLGGAVPYVGGAGRLYLAYLVVADRADAAGVAVADHAIRAEQGVVGQEYPQIGVVLAYAADADFGAEVRAQPGIAAAGASRTAPVTSPLVTGSATGAAALKAFSASSASSAPSGRPGPSERGASAGTGSSRASSASGPVVAGDSATVAHADDIPMAPDPHGQLQWFQNMVGESSPLPASDSTALRHVVVAVLDSGVDDTHPDLRSSVDPSRSVSCATGTPDTRPGAWRPDPELGESGHGTHVSGMIAADRPGDGAVGIAPGARIAAVRLLGDAGQYYGENLVCGFLWAADHGAAVINDSYFADPWKYNCPENPDQAAITAAVGRAVRYAQDKGALVVASAGNDAQDLAGPRIDDRSPNDHVDSETPPVRHLGAECIRLPGGLPGVLDVTALVQDGSLAGYSNWGAGQVALAAPGGDPDGGIPQAVVSDWPGGRYAALAGTSMAAASVSGVAAVEAARHPDVRGAALGRLLEQQTMPLGCASRQPGTKSCPGGPYYGYGLADVR
ncbi:S8 family peptidase [Streptacidiphilus fuscans]|uniref:S8 family serine peptidase n=1 Tax=Streptacidiphilus fuscans TaxID=2789292 RepID=A0A931FJB7_9ACTN|nr:S8 family serine peptidase [Streptacidiphilus fuscans]MBF9073806.1 S8 family serine peptidase [Streptacidiphilus fuscans]